MAAVKFISTRPVFFDKTALTEINTHRIILHYLFQNKFSRSKNCWIDSETLKKTFFGSIDFEEKIKEKRHLKNR